MRWSASGGTALPLRDGTCVESPALLHRFTSPLHNDSYQ